MARLPKPKGLRAASVSPGIAAHRATIWSALGPVMLLAGVALGTTAWLRVPSASASHPQPSVFDGVATSLLLSLGVLCVLVGLYIIAALFLPLPLPRTRHERELGRWHRADAYPGGATQREDGAPVLSLPPPDHGAYEVETQPGGATVVRPARDNGEVGAPGRYAEQELSGESSWRVTATEPRAGGPMRPLGALAHRVTTRIKTHFCKE